MTAEYSKVVSVADGWITEAIANQAVEKGEAIDCEFSWMLDALMSEEPATGWAVLKAISGNHRVAAVDDVFGMGPLSSFIFHHGMDFRKAIYDFWSTHHAFQEQYKMVVFGDIAEAIISPDKIARNG